MLQRTSITDYLHHVRKLYSLVNYRFAYMPHTRCLRSPKKNTAAVAFELIRNIFIIVMSGRVLLSPLVPPQLFYESLHLHDSNQLTLNFCLRPIAVIIRHDEDEQQTNKLTRPFLCILTSTIIARIPWCVEEIETRQMHVKNKSWGVKKQ